MSQLARLCAHGELKAHSFSPPEGHADGSIAYRDCPGGELLPLDGVLKVPTAGDIGRLFGVVDLWTDAQTHDELREKGVKALETLRDLALICKEVSE
jgi:hypothetical protein